MNELADMTILELFLNYWYVGFLYFIKLAKNMHKDHKELHGKLTDLLQDHGERISKLEGASKLWT